MFSHLQHQTGEYEELTSGDCERSSVLTANEKIGTHAFFYELDLCAEGRLCDADAFGGTAETALFSYSYKRDEMAELWTFIHDCHDQSTRWPGDSWQSVVALSMVRNIDY
jgi:hypothetical protein